MDVAEERRRGPHARAGAPPAGSRGRLPYLLILPAICFELLVHVIPLVTGVGISFLRLNQFFIRNWSAAPFEGFGNYEVALELGGADRARSCCTRS